MTGANAKAKVTYIAQYAGAQDSHKVMGVISLADGGELTVNRIYKRESTTSSTSESAWNAVKDKVTNTVLYLTFDGGILKTGQAGEFFQSADGSRVPDRVLVYEKGATIDTDGKDVTWRAPLARPEGKGLASVSINNATWTSANYAVGPSVIKVWNNGWLNNGGTAIVDFDKTFGSMKAVATFTTPLGSLPSLTLVDSGGDDMPPSGLWCLMLTDGGRTLKFGALHGTMLIFK